MKGILLSIVISSVRRLLSRVILKAGKNLWDATWSEIFTAIERAERRWQESGEGEKKKEWVISTVLDYIKERASLNWLQHKMVSFFISAVADAIVETVNEEVGHSWLKSVKSLEEELSHKIPFF